MRVHDDFVISANDHWSGGIARKRESTDRAAISAIDLRKSVPPKRRFGACL